MILEITKHNRDQLRQEVLYLYREHKLSMSDVAEKLNVPRSFVARCLEFRVPKMYVHKAVGCGPLKR